MNKYFCLIALLISGFSASATVDGHTKIYLVVQDIQSEEFFLERAPLIGCYGLPQGPQLVQWVSEYKAPSNVGCGGQTYEDNINVLTCAKVIKEKESEDYMSFSKITLDISECKAKDDPRFITMVRTSAKLNFPQSDSSKEVELTLVK